MVRLLQFSLAVSVAAIAVLVLATLRADEEHSGRGGDVEIRQALTAGAKVLAADTRGAVTETGNGVVRGWTRGLERPGWRVQFDRFGGAAGVIDASAWCARTCPSALVEFGGHFTARGAADALAAQLEGSPPARPLALLTAQRALVLKNLAPGARSGALAVFTGRSQEPLPAGRPSIAYADAAGRRVLAGAPEGAVGLLTRLSRGAAGWRAAAPPLRERHLQNLCISADGRQLGVVSTRILMLSFAARRPQVVGSAVAGGICRADAAGLTAVVNPASRAGSVRAVRFGLDGRRIWQRDLGSVQLLSPTGSPLIVTRDAGAMLTVVDAVSGRTTLRRRIPGQLLVAADGAIVGAGRDGRPRWIAVSAPAP